ncbi:MAG: shikimate dehydrogenase [Flavobacteriaceae bacterium]|nr:shikimate dehydrogenase [Flavobacteriaceae bacterium]
MDKNIQSIYGLLGKNISYSFSKTYFTQKFKDLHLENCSYLNFDLQEINQLQAVLNKNKNLKGLNVTIPYKQDIIPYLDSISDEAKHVGAVNTVKIVEGKLAGYNTDIFGFETSLKLVCNETNGLALILGTGGASKAVHFVLQKLGYDVIFISRKAKGNNILSYANLTKDSITSAKLIVNCTPLGTFPKVDEFPNIPYQFLHRNQLLFDLVYNPPLTQFLIKGQKKGTLIKNGYDMLTFQAEKSWALWNS